MGSGLVASRLRKRFRAQGLGVLGLSVAQLVRVGLEAAMAIVVRVVTLARIKVPKEGTLLTGPWGNVGSLGDPETLNSKHMKPEAPCTKSPGLKFRASV